MSDEHFVYGLVQAGELKYVGMSYSPEDRAIAHKRSGTVDGDFDLVILCRSPSRLAALKTEATLIQSLNPEYNKCHRTDGRLDEDEARAIWFSRPEESDADVLEDMPGWSASRAAWRFGSRRDWRWSDEIYPLWAEE